LKSVLFDTISETPRSGLSRGYQELSEIANPDFGIAKEKPPPHPKMRRGSKRK